MCVRAFFPVIDHAKSSRSSLVLRCNCIPRPQFIFMYTSLVDSILFFLSRSFSLLVSPPVVLLTSQSLGVCLVSAL